MSKRPETIETGSKNTDSLELPKLNVGVIKYNLKRKGTKLDKPKKKSKYIPPIGNIDVFAEGIVPGSSKEKVPEKTPPPVQSDLAISTEFNVDLVDLDTLDPDAPLMFTYDPMWPVFDPQDDVYLGPVGDLN